MRTRQREALTRFLAVPATLAACTGSAMAQQNPTPPDYSSPSVNFTWVAGYEHQFDTDIDGGGSPQYDVDRIWTALASDIKFNEEFRLGLTLGYNFDDYGFSGSGAFGDGPWGDIHMVTLAAILKYQIDSDWGVFGGPVMQFAGESGADWGDSITGGGVFGVSWRLNNELSISAGLGIITQLEDDVRVFPTLSLDWELTDSLSLRTTSVARATGYPAIELVYEFARDWEAAVGGSYEFRRFRLDDDGPVPDGVGQETRWPIWARVGYNLNSNWTFSALVGFSAQGDLKLEDSSGDHIAEEDTDLGFVMAFGFRVRF